MTNSANQNFLVIERWMLANVENHGYERFEDLHIDQISSDWKYRDSWIDGGLSAFELALDARSRHALDLVVVVAFSLKAAKERRCFSPQTTKELKTELGFSPPSLYLFERGQEPWTEPGLRKSGITREDFFVELINPIELGPKKTTHRCYYMEFRQGEFDEESRTVFLAE
jgi:hypothetical protein